MKFAIITHVPHGINDKGYFAYAPYVREMNIWGKFVDEVVIVAPLELQEETPIHINYDHQKISFRTIKSMNLLTLRSKILALLQLPVTFLTICKAMQAADHIHLRCPGNIGLLGCIAQILFPSKPKTAKYAGNWDPKAQQPLSYRIQKWLLNNTFLTKNMQVLVYGQWAGSSNNIKPFFTASYRENDKIDIQPRLPRNPLLFIFAGSLAAGKQPIYAIKLVEKMLSLGYDARLNLYGEGNEKSNLQEYCIQNRIQESIVLMGNANQMTLRKAYQQSHFVILPSKSEGWPKVIAEAMFWGAVPLASPVSCVPDMLGNGERGILLSMDLLSDMSEITNLIQQPENYLKKAKAAMQWSARYTLDYFEQQVEELIKKEVI